MLSKCPILDAKLFFSQARPCDDVWPDLYHHLMFFSKAVVHWFSRYLPLLSEIITGVNDAGLVGGINSFFKYFSSLCSVISIYYQWKQKLYNIRGTHGQLFKNLKSAPFANGGHHKKKIVRLQQSSCITLLIKSKKKWLLSAKNYIILNN